MSTKVNILNRFIVLARAYSVPYFITDGDMHALEKDIKLDRTEDESYMRYQIDLLINDPLRMLFRDDAVTAGAIFISYNSAYGGYRIDQFHGAGEDFFDGSERRTGKAFYDYMGTQIRALRKMKDMERKGA